MKILTSPWTASLLGVALYLATTALFWHPIPPGSADAGDAVYEGAGPSWTFQNAEIDQLVTELKRERELLSEREKQLNDLAARLQSERLEINQVTQQVHQLEVEFDQNVVRAREEETVNLKKLARMYAAMTPEGSAMIFKQLDDTSLVKILMYMKDAETAPILETMAKQNEAQARRAAALSERLRLALPHSPTAKRGS